MNLDRLKYNLELLGFSFLFGFFIVPVFMVMTIIIISLIGNTSVSINMGNTEFYISFFISMVFFLLSKTIIKIREIDGK